MGQTVAASFQTPTLFLIGKDLTQMQVDTNVSESDIGLAQVGQRALFTVEAYPRQDFEGKVVQVRHAPITVQNIVTYNVVIGVDNPDNQLLPGMTANARILVEERKGVKIVPARALRFDPDGVGAARAKDEPAAADHRVWVLRDGDVIAVPVSIGLEDGTHVDIKGDSLAVGDLVIVDVADGELGGAPAARPPLRF
jgi:HlyD family secretion protein